MMTQKPFVEPARRSAEQRRRPGLYFAILHSRGIYL
jgi:hypothetical protein